MLGHASRLRRNRFLGDWVAGLLGGPPVTEESSNPVTAQYAGGNSLVSALIVSHNSGNNGSRVPSSSCAAGTPFSERTFDPMMRKARRMWVKRHFRKASS